MLLIKRIWRSGLMITLRNWEHWPFLLIQLPVYPYYLWLSAAARSFSFFSSCNPGIAMGGLLGESKSEILEKLPAHLVPPFVKVQVPATLEMVVQAMEIHHLRFPVIFKPDEGEGGWKVEKVHSADEAQRYLQSIRLPFIIQQYVEGPLEFSIFFRHYPFEANGSVISLTRKQFLSVTGDGCSTLNELILRCDRTRLYRKKLCRQYASQWEQVIPRGEEKVLVSMGNHLQGATFYDEAKLINERLHQVFNTIGQSVPGFYYGKFDVRCESVQDLYNGHIKILELNGCGATPSHIFEPGKSYVKCVARLWRHWKDIYSISMANKRRGYDPIPARLAWRYFKRYMRLVGR